MKCKIFEPTRGIHNCTTHWKWVMVGKWMNQGGNHCWSVTCTCQLSSNVQGFVLSKGYIDVIHDFQVSI